MTDESNNLPFHSRVPSSRQSLEPLRQTLQTQPFFGGETPLYPDYIVFGGFQWARAISPFAIARKRRPYREMARTDARRIRRPGTKLSSLLKTTEHRSLLSIYVETIVDAAMHLSSIARERLDFRDDSGGRLKGLALPRRLKRAWRRPLGAGLRPAFKLLMSAVIQITRICDRQN
jgi:hypothetical protein